MARTPQQPLALPPRGAEHPACILLCAGRGTRMGTRRLNKVCLPVAGVPAVVRTLRAFRACGVKTQVVVVGPESDDILEAVGAEPFDVLFALQPAPRGTGDAARCGARPLLEAGFRGPVFVAVGDKVVEPAVVRRVLERFHRTGADLALAVSRRPEATDMGRLLLDGEGRPAGIVEAVDLRMAALHQRLGALAQRGEALDPARLRVLCIEMLGDEKHLARLGRLQRALAGPRPVPAERLAALLPPPRLRGRVRLGRMRIPYREAVAGPPLMNESLYLFRADALARMLERLPAAARRGERYLTDAVHLLAQDRPPRRVVPVTVPRGALIAGFNTPGQLMRLEEVLRRREGGVARVKPRRRLPGRRVSKPVAEWLRLFEEVPPAMRRALRALYGPDPARRDAKRREYLAALRLFARRYGASARAVIARAPGSVNLMGRHVDIEGGFVNMMAVDLEALVVAAPRADDRIRVCSESPRFRDIEFTLSGELAALDWDDWLQYVSSAKVRQMVAASRDNRSHYLKAAVLRLQQRFHHLRLVGMDCVVSCALPSAAGLGASGAVVAAASQATVALNGLDLSPADLMLLCAEGQWYVTPGFSGGEHVAPHEPQGGQVTQVRFHPLEVQARVPFPEDWAVLLCLAGDTPPLSLGLRQRRAAAMHLALLVLRHRFPAFGHLLERVRDLDPQRLGIAPSELYDLLAAVPLSASPRGLRRLLPASCRETLERVFASHEPAERYPLRDAALFGAAECARARALPALLERGEAVAVGRLMAASHEAERVVPPPGRARLWTATAARLRRLAADLRRGDPRLSARARLALQPGRYGSSTPLLDAVVDAVTPEAGVVGAQLSGTGQGGCVMVVAHREAVAAVRARVAHVAPRIRTIAAGPVAGSALFST